MTLKLKSKDNHVMPPGRRIGLIPLYSYVFICDFSVLAVVRVLM